MEIVKNFESFLMGATILIGFVSLLKALFKHKFEQILFIILATAFICFLITSPHVLPKIGELLVKGLCDSFNIEGVV